MNLLLKNKYVSEMDCGSNFSYILNDSSMFLSTEYKVLQNQVHDNFAKCMKMQYNGKIQLFYVVNSYKSFASMLNVVNEDSFLSIISNILSHIIDVKHNGFLLCQSIDISYDHIYIDPTTYKVKLVYLPINKRMYSDYAVFEKELRTGFVQLITNRLKCYSPQMVQFTSDLSNGTLTIEDLYKRMKQANQKDIPTGTEKPITNTVPVTQVHTAQLIAMNAPNRVEMDINKAEYIIGKKPTAVDGVISFNKMISRVHCKINTSNGHYTITDLQSANGTFINNVRLLPNKSYPVKSGDMVRLANSDFQFLVKKERNG